MSWCEIGDLDIKTILSYLGKAATTTQERWTAVEGQVHGVLGCKVTQWSIVNREASTSFRDNTTRQDWLDQTRTVVSDALTGVSSEAWFAVSAGKTRGVSPDFLALDDAGRLLVVEAKPAMEVSGIAASPAQVAVYARAMRAWVDQDLVAARTALELQLKQRVDLGLSTHRVLADPIVVVPVVVVGWGSTSSVARPRLAQVAQAMDMTRPEGIAPLEVYRVSPTGDLDVWPDDGKPPPYSDVPVRARTFEQRARLKAVEWKLAQGIEEEGLHQGHPVAYLLPEAEAVRNLLPAAAGAVEFFAQKKIRWHQGSNGGPSANLVSSQVQCVNALFPLTAAQVQQAFAPVLPIEEVLSLEGRPVTFEYGGLADHLRERRGVRGAWATWADAAFCFAVSGEPDTTAIALVEWKFTESYRPSSTPWNATQMARYQHLVEAGDVLKAGTDVTLLHGEPYFQLMRQQLLAAAMQKAGEADRVYVVHVSPSGDTAYRAQMAKRPWQKFLVDPGAFRTLDSDVFCTGRPDYAGRYDLSTTSPAAGAGS